MDGVSIVPIVLESGVQEKVPNTKILVVGAGGIGCEILKNLALSGFEDIEIIDLDTIDVSNLNRQFLFRKEHVGKSKAVVARETMLNYNPNLKIKAYHDSITTTEYGVNFFKRFGIVLNALDNLAARNHVNRMCLAADVPLIESGTAGYTGQVELIKKGLTQCYECQTKPTQKTFPGCTIRNTPSEPVHCIVWAKHLFNQLFGEDDPDQDVSPDTADPEAAGNAGEEAMKTVADTGNMERKSTKQWAQDIDYNPEKLFNKFFTDDINYLLSMSNLWKSRKSPIPITWSETVTLTDGNDTETEHAKNEMQVWSINKCAKIFESSIVILKKDLTGKDFLVWDKDYKPAMDFVTACTNVRAHIFTIPKKSRFDVKSIAGNIIPAIATTNAIVAGLVVLHAFKVLAEEYEKCQTIYVRQKSLASKTVLMAETTLAKANPKCYVCSPQPFVNIYLNINNMTCQEFESEILKKGLNMIAPDAMLEGKNVLIISSEEGETECNNNKKLSELGVGDGCTIKVDDFLQNYALTVCVNQYEAKEKDDPLFKISAEDLKSSNDQMNGESNGSAEEQISRTSNDDDNDKNKDNNDDDDDDIALVEDDVEEGTSSKRRRIHDDDDIVMLDD